MRWGVYISGPGIVGRMIMHAGYRDHDALLVFDTESEAFDVARALHGVRPYHFVEQHPYEEGDELRGKYAAHPDGVT